MTAHTNRNTPPKGGTELHDFGYQDVWLGFRQLVPLSLFVTLFGLAFGLAATQTGLDGAETVMMSALVFAGASQFAALELWGPQVAIVPLTITVFAINARHLLMGASLYPWLRHLPPAKRYGVMLVASDANWALAMQAFARGKPGIGLLLGGGIALWVFWVLGTLLGLYFGKAIQDPVRFGLDMVMGCFLLAMVVGGPKSPRIFIIWTLAASASLLAYRYLPENSHVVVGALAGGALGALWMEQPHDP
ncbi:MAG: AzlC family ABC transporter permease [Marinobacter sp.]|nr:AzlC family ABC transporter permease [Marinobacter sp.]